MPDEGSMLTDKAVSQVERRIRKIYKEAEQDIARKMADFTAKHAAKDAQMQAKLKAGEITKEEYQRWQRGQVFIGKQWEAKKESIADTLYHANERAQAIVNEQARDVFATNFNYQNFELEQTAGIDMGFGLYDSATVGRLIKERPRLLPQPKPGKYKDNRWNNRNISNSITQSIIQGEGIPEAAKRLAQATGETNMRAMRMHARTALTGAQNAGRIEAMHEQQDMGIEVKKKWIATLDDRTRDTHAELDGQTVDVDEPFVVYDSEGHKLEIMEPGDPNADPSLVYNCRCTLGYVYPKYDHLVNHDRNYRTVVEDKDENGNVIGTRVEYKNAGDVTFKEWQEGKKTELQFMQQDGIISSGDGLPAKYDGDFSDYEALTLKDEELSTLQQLHEKAVETGYEYGSVCINGEMSEMFTSSAEGRVSIPKDIMQAEHLDMYHSHTNESTLSGKDFQLLTNPNVDSVSVKAINGDVYTVRIGNGYRPSAKEFEEALAEIRVQADEYIMDYDDFMDWTPRQRMLMGTREQALLIIRRFGWSMEGGRP